jgi:hypothetical protein
MKNHESITALESLSEKEWVLICSRAEGLCIHLMSRLARAVSASDPALSCFLYRVADDERRHLDRLLAADRALPWPTVCQVNEPAIRGVLAEWVPALAHATDIDNLSSAAIKKLVDAVERQSARFYRHLASLAAAPQYRSLFLQIAEEEEAHGSVLTLGRPH